MSSAHSRLLNLLAERSFRLGDFVLASGARSDYYIDCRTSTMHAHGQVLMGEVGLAAIRDAGLRPDAVGGLTMGADPLAYAIAAASWRGGDPIHAFSVRKQTKRHGKGQLIEGCFEPGARVVVVEDVITTGGSAFQAVEAVNRARGEVLGVLGLVDREEGGRATLEGAGLRTMVLYTASDLRAAVAASA
ncbi:MAG: orotate phosphoribosyltransferase [Gemmatimonadales bacterium]|nr:orotate phosphoribosyltransferase [Gemmatimonadales bacterium]MYG18531.1 orotate phosphoribosyltransferase [Gemmatimonadales bacterium]MYH09474.1 orotate phosphoribosyltransferase [Gemmatimonadales bacterium]MYL05744.1 orotate phosphoribosyltransferase [Gemmatimonadales bacterium]